MLRLLLALALAILTAAARAQDYDVCVYGATPGGIAAAIAAASDGSSVLLIEPGDRIGGMITNGLTHSDFRTFESLSGAFLDFTQRVEAHYRDTFGPDSQQVRDSLRGTQFEPKVALAVFDQMLAEHPKITISRHRSLVTLRSSTDGDTRTIEILSLMDDEGNRTTVSAYVFIDATYEGDLMAAAKIPYLLGREARSEFSEPLAPEKADAQLQAYNFRLTMTRDPDLRIPARKPPGYDTAHFADLLPILRAGKITRLFDTGPPAIFKAQEPRLPNAKYDINDVSHSAIRLSLPGENLDWPDGFVGSIAPFSRTGLMQARAPVFDTHLRWQLGLLYFLQNDERIPERYRTEAREWGLCRDEYPDNGHLPHQLYIREARRMDGAFLFTERDTHHAPGDARAILHTDSIATGDYGPNCHGTGHTGPRIGGQHTGEFYQPAVPYQIPYGVLTPRSGVDNLLVCGAISSTHIGYCALRLEPIWMSLGQAAGHAAHLARKTHIPVQAIPIPQLQARLHARQSATIYISDVPPGHPQFALLQKWATAGALHSLFPQPEKTSQRGKPITGQYHEAFPFHTADLGESITPDLRTRWTALAGKMGIPPEKIPSTDKAMTRGEWLHAVLD